MYPTKCNRNIDEQRWNIGKKTAHSQWKLETFLRCFKAFLIGLLVQVVLDVSSLLKLVAKYKRVIPVVWVLVGNAVVGLEGPLWSLSPGALGLRKFFRPVKPFYYGFSVFEIFLIEPPFPNITPE